MNRNYLSFSALTLILATLLSGCASTIEEDEPPTCGPDMSTCPEETDTSKDRGYDPCLINKDLAVCQKDG